MHMIARKSALILTALACVATSSLAGPTVSTSKPSITRGKVIFDKNTCNVCHENGGNTINKNKPIKGSAFQKRFPSDDALSKLIRQGVKGTSMPAFGKDKIGDVAMIDLIAYIRSLTPGTCK
jgi:mono/diheme cytochrome c family protein